MFYKNALNRVAELSYSSFAAFVKVASVITTKFVYVLNRNVNAPCVHTQQPSMAN